MYMYMYMYIYICYFACSTSSIMKWLCIHVYMYIYTYMYICIYHTYMYICIHVYMCTHIYYLYVHMHIYIYKYIWTIAYTYICLHMYTYNHAWIPTHTHTHNDTLYNIHVPCHINMKHLQAFELTCVHLTYHTPCQRKRINMKRDLYMWKRDGYMWKETQTCEKRGSVRIIRVTWLSKRVVDTSNTNHPYNTIQQGTAIEWWYAIPTQHVHVTPIMRELPLFSHVSISFHIYPSLFHMCMIAWHAMQSWNAMQWVWGSVMCVGLARGRAPHTTPHTWHAMQSCNAMSPIAFHAKPLHGHVAIRVSWHAIRLWNARQLWNGI